MKTINQILVEILKLKEENEILKNENKVLRNKLNIHMNNELDLMLKLKGFKDYIKAYAFKRFFQDKYPLTSHSNSNTKNASNQSISHFIHNIRV